MAASNRDAAASIGLPAAADSHPGWSSHLINAKMGRTPVIRQNASRSANRGFRIGRRAQSR